MMTPKQVLLGAAVLVAGGIAAHFAPTGSLSDSQVKMPKQDGFGYLQGVAIDGVASLPPPPAPRSPAMEKDEAARAAALKLNDPARYAQAVADSGRSFSNTLKIFSCAMGMDISEQATPRVAHLLDKMRIDARRAAGPLRDRYKRTRPFIEYKSKTCSPADEALVAGQGSYPSARTAVGWSYALVLAELNPDRSEAILQRGRDFGESRVICDAQWQSDVDAGNEVGRLVVERLHRDRVFNADLEAAKSEIARLRAAGARPSGPCPAPTAIASSR